MVIYLLYLQKENKSSKIPLKRHCFVFLIAKMPQEKDMVFYIIYKAKKKTAIFYRLRFFKNMGPYNKIMHYFLLEYFL